ncbi:MAG: glucuronate isomerase [bacterium]
MLTKLQNRLFETLVETPLIDIHTHLSPSELSSNNLARLFFYHYIVDELKAAGASSEAISSDQPAKERLAAAMPFIPYIQNTSTYWMFTIIARDLFEFDEPLTLKNWQNLAAQVDIKCSEPDWPSRVLSKSNIEFAFLTFNWNHTWKPFDQSLLRATVRLDTLLDGPVNSSMIKTLESLSNIQISTAKNLNTAIFKLVEHWQSNGVVALATSYEIDYRLEDLSTREVNAALEVILTGQAGAVDAGLRLNGYFLHRALEACADFKLPLQLFIGIGATTSGKRVPIHRQNLVRDFYPIFLQYPQVKFDLLLANLAQSQEVWVAGKMNPNVYVSGAWWYNFQPSTLRKLWRERLEGLPANKACAFFSDAYTIEWNYAKAYHMRSQLAQVLAEFVANGFYNERHAEQIGRWLLYNNPKQLYFSHQTVL